MTNQKVFFQGPKEQNCLGLQLTLLSGLHDEHSSADPSSQDQSKQAHWLPGLGVSRDTTSGHMCQHVPRHTVSENQAHTHLGT